MATCQTRSMCSRCYEDKHDPELEYLRSIPLPVQQVIYDHECDLVGFTTALNSVMEGAHFKSRCCWNINKSGVKPTHPLSYSLMLGSFVDPQETKNRNQGESGIRAHDPGTAKVHNSVLITALCIHLCILFK